MLRVMRGASNALRAVAFPIVFGGGIAAIYGAANAGVDLDRIVIVTPFVAGAVGFCLERIIPFEPSWLEERGDIRTDVLHFIVSSGAVPVIYHASVGFGSPRGFSRPLHRPAHVLSAPALKRFPAPPIPKQMVVLVTGASSGFGRLLAARLAGRGHTVFGTSRRGAAVDGSVPILRLDVRDDASVTACVAAVRDRAGDVDVLVNNAGYVHEGPLEELALDDVKGVFETNFFGAVRMVNAVLPAMRTRRSGRIVNVSSLAGLMPLPFVGAYCASKHALESYSESLRHELLPLGIHVSLVEPGYFKTGIADRKLRSAGTIADYDAHRRRMYAAIARDEYDSPAPDAVVDLLVRVVEAKRPRLRHVIGKDTLTYRLRGVVPEMIWERGLRRTFHLDA
jgi:NAD(P)-dependent dehydrogenase (short-subunit alcohol dehydrogenase family)